MQGMLPKPKLLRFGWMAVLEAMMVCQAGTRESTLTAAWQESTQVHQSQKSQILSQQRVLSLQRRSEKGRLSETD